MKVLQELDPEGVALRKKNILEDAYTNDKVCSTCQGCIDYLL